MISPGSVKRENLFDICLHIRNALIHNGTEQAFFVFKMPENQSFRHLSFPGDGPGGRIGISPDGQLTARRYPVF